MGKKNIFKDDVRIEKILDLLLKYNLGDYSGREVVSPEGDELDAIIIGLNTLGEETESSGKIVRDFEKRVGKIMDTLQKYTLFDFSEKIPVGNIGDELDAIAIGLNTMAEELESARQIEKSHLDKITASEQRFRGFIESAPDAMVIVNKEGNIELINTLTETLFGYRTDELIGQKVEVLIPDRFKGSHPGHRHNYFSNPKVRGMGAGLELFGRKKDGSEFPIEISLSPIQTKEGVIVSAAIRDITEKKKAENELKRINHFLDTILENIPNMVFVKDAKELRFVRFNKAGEELLGYSRADLIGKNDYDFFPKEQADFFTAKDREALAKKEVTDIPEELINTANGQKWLHTKKIPLFDHEGNAAYLLGISEDITTRKANEDRIKLLNKELQNNITLLENSNTELEAFTYSVSHDLRAPLRAIHGYTAIIEKECSDKLNAEAKGMMTAVMNNALKMGRLIDDLLSLSRYGKKELQKKETDMTELVKQSLEELKKSSENTAKASITIKPLHKAWVDNALMFQVFFNLLSNAVKYSSLKEKPEITVESKKENGETVYIVSDNGTGFDMKYYDKLFGVFHRLHDANEFEGTGVGLALVKRIITKHNGRVWAHAEVGKGATFYFALKTED